MNASPRPSLARLSLSLPAEFFFKFSVMLAERGVANRSQMSADLVRKALAEDNTPKRPKTGTACRVT